MTDGENRQVGLPELPGWAWAAVWGLIYFLVGVSSWLAGLKGLDVLFLVGVPSLAAVPFLTRKLKQDTAKERKAAAKWTFIAVAAICGFFFGFPSLYGIAVLVLPPFLKTRLPGYQFFETISTGDLILPVVFAVVPPLLSYRTYAKCSTSAKMGIGRRIF